MIVLDHRPHAWFLLEDAGGLFLDVACTHSFMDYSVLIELNDQENQSFEAHGGTFLDRLAHEIHFSAPAVLGSQSPYRSRNLTASRGAEVIEAVRMWQADRSG